MFSVSFFPVQDSLSLWFNFDWKRCLNPNFRGSQRNLRLFFRTDLFVFVQ